MQVEYQIDHEVDRRFCSDRREFAALYTYNNDVFEPVYPQGQGFIAAIKIKEDG